jgi:hypothetical protein
MGFIRTIFPCRGFYSHRGLGVLHKTTDVTDREARWGTPVSTTSG